MNINVARLQSIHEAIEQARIPLTKIVHPALEIRGRDDVLPVRICVCQFGAAVFDFRGLLEPTQLLGNRSQVLSDFFNP